MEQKEGKWKGNRCATILFGQRLFSKMLCTFFLFETVELFRTPSIHCAKCFMSRYYNLEYVLYPGRNLPVWLCRVKNETRLDGACIILKIKLLKRWKLSHTLSNKFSALHYNKARAVLHTFCHIFFIQCIVTYSHDLQILEPSNYQKI